jgi:TatD DNase family protein
MQLVDIGANLTHASFRDDLDAVLARAREHGVGTIVVTGTSPAETRKALKLDFWTTAGVHPHNAKDCGASTLDELRELAREPKVVAIGECGLDYNRNYSPHPDQEKWFVAQLELAAELGKPLFLHSRDAHPRFAEILRNLRVGKAVAHCFTGEAEELRAYLDLDLYIGITGWICDERRGRHLVALVKEIPQDRLLLETDAPYLTPRDLQPQPKARRNEPAYLPHILRAVARARGEAPEALAAATTRNAKAFFGIA